MTRKYFLSPFFLVVALSPAFFQITYSCERGNTFLLNLELEVSGQDQIANFSTTTRSYAVTISSSAAILRVVTQDPASIATYRWFVDGTAVGPAFAIGTGGGEVTVTVPDGQSQLYVNVQAPEGAFDSYIVDVERVDQPGGPCTKTQIVNVACTESVTNTYHRLPWELSVSVPTAITGGGTFDAQFDGEVVFTETYLDFWQAVIPGGATSMEILDSAATVQVRSGATGPDVVLGIDDAALSPGATQFCNFPTDQICLVDGDCLGGVCNAPILLQNFPTSTDCSVGGVCDLIGKNASQCLLNGFCVTGGLAMELAASAPTTYTADQSGNVLFGWADQGVPGLSICPVGFDCSRPLPDDAYNLPQAVYANPTAPMGLRFAAPVGTLFLANQCAMGEDGGACSTTASQGCLTDADCPGAETCIGVGVDDDIIMPTPDVNLISCPIDEGVPPVSCADLVCNFTVTDSAITNYYVPSPVNPVGVEALPWSGTVNIDCEPNGDQCDCAAEFPAVVGPITVPGLGDLCVIPKPANECPTGTVSCDAGTDKNITQTQLHALNSTCGDNPTCRTQCEDYCTNTLGAARVENSPACEGFCRTGDVSLCWPDDYTEAPPPDYVVCGPNDTCDELGFDSGEGGPLESTGHEGFCGCQCVGIGDGAPTGPGEALLYIGYEVEVFFDNDGDGIAELGVGPDGVACTADDEVAPGTLPEVCVPFTTSTASAYLPDAGYFDPNLATLPIDGTIAPPDRLGTPFTCVDGVPSTAVGAVLQGVWTTVDSRRNDFASMLTITCE